MMKSDRDKAGSADGNMGAGAIMMAVAPRFVVSVPGLEVAGPASRIDENGRNPPSVNGERE